jgi:hypothetical protein
VKFAFKTFGRIQHVPTLPVPFFKNPAGFRVTDSFQSVAFLTAGTFGVFASSVILLLPPITTIELKSELRKLFVCHKSLRLKQNINQLTNQLTNQTRTPTPFPKLGITNPVLAAYCFHASHHSTQDCGDAGP